MPNAELAVLLGISVFLINGVIAQLGHRHPTSCRDNLRRRQELAGKTRDDGGGSPNPHDGDSRLSPCVRRQDPLKI